MLRMSTTDSYIKRHMGNDEGEVDAILKKLEVKTIDQLMAQTIPDAIRIPEDKIFLHNGKTF